eukprot:8493854-Pyramimonas_sp.AAC.1
MGDTQPQHRSRHQIIAPRHCRAKVAKASRMTSAEPVWLRHAENTHKTENEVRIGAPNEAEKI